MIEIERSKLIKYYIATNIIVLLNYNLFSEQLPITTIIPIQLLLSLNLIAVGLYALFKDNIVLNSSDNFEKSTVIGIVTQYAPICELFKLIFSSEERARAFTTPVYLLSILFHSLLNDKYPQFFDKFKKFNFGFSIQYLILFVFNVQFNKLIPCIILGVVATYYSSLTLNYMTIITSNIIYSTVLVEGLLPLIIILSPSKDGATVLIGFLIGGIATVAIYLIAVISQFRKVNNDPEDGYTQVESGNTQSSDNNYSTFNN
ncbi:hypothetical protein CONCODRAFT_80923 [Conidiobolus coronatus NRRL 28638]|uniref:Uncharacterized protein n=1 Tax=Conidiobolus coronatus (strain ATCC 28846 / CBS 209.66 / NRRL 28638) TaxID=796925 RepID=A0A137NPN6_CONC2|nr:hypothetical protein CONCODRAFT_80923 [Conidiobolus coronatus NRRL 28638]|eukprot:KXN64694.1 hypothetical protein CONCODRAFT_80923 [Conidiobolus coronatus NRRL 28638]